MTTDSISNKALVRRLFEDVWNRGDMASAAVILAHPDGVQRYVSEFRTAFPDVHHEVREMITEGNVVAVSWSARATHRGTWLGLPATGKAVEWTGITIVHVADGKVVEHDTRWDMLAFARQLGAIPAGTWLPLRA